jgi:cysteinyl-tRNA synthetase
MKTKLTLNVDDKIVARAKRASAKRKVSLSSVVENYLEKYSRNNTQLKNSKPAPDIIQRIRKYTRPVEISDSEIKKQLTEYLEKKHA